MNASGRTRSRLLLTVAILLVVLAGLASRVFPFWLPSSLGKYPGDALWALMIFIGIAVIRPDLKSWQLACTAITVCFAVEFSQLYQAPWINVIRAHPFGHLVLGSTFNWPDLLAYVAGAFVGWVTDGQP